MELKKGLDASPCGQRTVGHRSAEPLGSGLSSLRWRERGRARPPLGRCRDIGLPPEGRISTWHQTDLRGCKGFSAQPCPASLLVSLLLRLTRAHFL